MMPPNYFLTAATAALLFSFASSQTEYEIGVGIADVTGPVAGVNLAGYGKFNQEVSGVRTRLWSRAFIFGDGQSRIVFVSVDAGMISALVRMEVIKKLQSKFGGLYNDTNVCLSASHTHSGPGGFFQYLLYNLPSLGFIKESMDAFVSGIVTSIERADKSIQPGKLYINQGTLLGANINRSPMTYLLNPEAERSRYQGDVDTEMTLLKLTDLEGKPIGMINWFPVHCTSVNNTNHLVDSDNKGLAALMFESQMEPGTLPGQTKFVAAFAQANEGDVSPNTMGPKCQNTGLPCESASSTCGGKNEMCYALGPGKDMHDSNKIIATKQFDKAWELFNDYQNLKPVSGPVKYIHQFVDMSKYTFLDANNQTKTTCPAALGHSFGAGTTDGPGAFDFKQNTLSGTESTFWNVVRDFLTAPSKQLQQCHSPKPILLPLGELNRPLPWAPKIINTQILQVGNLVILAAPGEFTTMSGRRMKEAVHKEILDNGEIKDNLQVVFAGLSNVYCQYITTYEEYQFQRYEASSTLFGPHTLEAYLYQYKKLARSLAKEEELEEGPSPPNLLSEQLSFVPPVIMDAAPFRKNFGDVLADALPSYSKGSEVKVKFVSGHPRNALQAGKQLGSTFLTVEKDVNGTWVVVATDANWETKFEWEKQTMFSPLSTAKVTWYIPDNADSGTYRIRHSGYRKKLLSGIKAYQGVSRVFTVS